MIVRNDLGAVATVIDLPRRTRKVVVQNLAFASIVLVVLVGIGVVAVYLLAFVVLNTGQVRVRFVVASTRVSLIWVILLSLGAGIVLGVLVSQLHRFRMRRRRAA